MKEVCKCKNTNARCVQKVYETCISKTVGWLVVLYSRSNLVGYFLPNPVYAYTRIIK